MSEIYVSELHVYPIKSCGGIAVESAVITETGLEHDRRFMLVDEENFMISQRNKVIGPRLVHVQPSFDTYSGPIAGKKNGNVSINIDGFGGMKLSTFLPPHKRIVAKPEKEFDLQKVIANIHGNEVAGAAVSAEANTFFSEYLGAPVRLLQVIGQEKRQINERRHKPDASNITGFADGYSMLLTSEKSLQELSRNPFLTDTYPDGLPMDRFRPNIAVDGESLQAYDEDYWKFIRIAGSVGAYIVKACDRCPIPDIDQETSNMGKEVRRALAMTRRGINDLGDSKGVFFGQNLNHIYKVGQRISVGDDVTIMKRSDFPNVTVKPK